MKCIIDTCVITDLTKKSVNAGLLAWYKQQKEDDLFISVISLAEISKGIELLAQGKKRKGLQQWFENMIHAFEDRIIPVEREVAILGGKIEANMKIKGFNFSLSDCLIAAAAVQTGMKVVTRNQKDFEKLGCDVLNPWDKNP
ncbi:MAG: type II toxin-antitoxin system VapC family toxin [Candidatus Omnitrophica bacterium]|nr:type II toxin-antitoxin system VapC family toxin [Candidatus Omnitrophota bacterium]